MNSGMDWQTPASSYTTVEMLLDDVSQQMASQNLSRYSRNTMGQRPAGPIRIAKPSSASNSPRGSMGLNRRRTVMNDGTYRRRLAMIDHNAVAAGLVSHDGLPAPPRSERPVSWHPASTHLTLQQPYQPAYQSQTTEAATQYQFYNFTPSAACSGYTSPSSEFSPQSIAFEQPAYPYQSPNTSFPAEQPSYLVNQQSAVGHPMHGMVQQSTYQDPAMYSHFDWNNFTSHGSEISKSAPPTPENFLPIQHPEPTLSADASIPYHSLSDDEDGEEVLVGMGLYDSPEPAKAPSADPQLDSYLMMTSLFTTATRRIEQTGKGLKLEETWNPPEDEDSDNGEDGEEEEEEEETAEETTIVVPVKTHTEQSVHPGFYQSSGFQNGHLYDREGWL